MTNKSKRTTPLTATATARPAALCPATRPPPMATPPEATETAEPSWSRDNAAILLKLAEAGIEIDTTKPAALAEETLADWTNDDAHAAEIFADQMTAEGSHMDEEGGDWLTADLNPIAIPAVLEPYLFRNVEQDDLADARTTPGDSAEKLDAIERETDEANAAAKQARHVTVILKLNNVGVTHPGGLDAADDAAATWTELQIAEIETLVAAVPQGGYFTDTHAGPIALLDGWTLHKNDDTFDAEQVAAASTAGEGAVIAEEGETVADPATATAPLDDGLVTIPTETAPVAVRLHELRTLVTARRLYKSPEGYSSNYGAPYIDQATIDAWIAAGLAEDVPTAGNHGGIRVTAEARSVLNRAPAPEAA